MTDEQFIAAIIDFFKGTQAGQPYQKNAIIRVTTAMNDYRQGKFRGKI
jgi:hypothetical protein